MLGRDVHGVCRRYREYFSRHAASAKEPKTMLDPAPRVILDPEFGLAASGAPRKRPPSRTIFIPTPWM